MVGRRKVVKTVALVVPDRVETEAEMLDTEIDIERVLFELIVGMLREVGTLKVVGMPRVVGSLGAVEMFSDADALKEKGTCTVVATLRVV